VLSGLRIEALINVSANGDVISSGSYGALIGCGITTHHPGMPSWPSYRLTSHATSGDVVLAVGPTPVYYQRHVGAAGEGPSVSSSTVGAPTAADRLRYVEALTGEPPAFSAYAHRSVRRSPALDTTAIAAEMRRDIEQRYARFVHGLVATGDVSEIEASGLSVEVAVTVVDVGR
jgi:hypothetical protein